MSELVQVRQRPNACCNVPANLWVEKVDQSKRIEHCTGCKCRHFIMEVDPVVFGVDGKDL